MMMKKLIALLMVLAMVLTLGAASAATNKDQIGKYYEVNDNTGKLASTPTLKEGAAGVRQWPCEAQQDH